MTDRERLLTLLREIREEVDFERQTALVDDGVLDSLDITVLVAEMEDSFGITLPLGEIEPENFNTVEDMLALLERRRAAR